MWPYREPQVSYRLFRPPPHPAKKQRSPAPPARPTPLSTTCPKSHPATDQRHAPLATTPAQQAAAQAIRPPTQRACDPPRRSPGSTRLATTTPGHAGSDGRSETDSRIPIVPRPAIVADRARPAAHVPRGRMPGAAGVPRTFIGCLETERSEGLELQRRMGGASPQPRRVRLRQDIRPRPPRSSPDPEGMSGFTPQRADTPAMYD